MAAKPKTQPPLSRQGTSWFDALSSGRKTWLCIALMALITVVIFRDVLFGGMIFSTSGDASAFRSWINAMEHIRTAEDRRDVFWIPYVFSGMPIFGTLLLPKDVNYAEIVLLNWWIKLIAPNWGEVRDVIHLFLAGVMIFLLARSFKFSHLASLVAGLTLMLNPYAVGAFEAHQGSKIDALSLIPLVFLLVYQLYKNLNAEKLLHWKNILLFGAIAAVSGWMALTAHVQMIFYGFFLVGCYLLYEIILNIRKEPARVVRNVFIIGIALVLGFTCAAYLYLPTQEYAQYSIRGGGGVGVKSGLDYDYATNWSFHPFEMLDYLDPSFFGFSSPYYWGWMPFTESTVYIGIVPILLAVIALAYRRNRLTWFLAIVSAIFFLMSFGRHFPMLYNLMFDYFPYFNKFRVPVLILHLIPLTVGVLAAAGLTVLEEMKTNAKAFNLQKFRKRLYVTVAIIGALLVIGFLANDAVYSALSGSMFQRNDDLSQLQGQYGQQAAQVLPQLMRERFDLLWKDYVKFALIAGASLGLIIAYLKKSFSASVLAAGLLVVLGIDLLIVDGRYVNPKPPAEATEAFTPDATVQFLKSDTTIYRVYPVGGEFQDNTMMYHLISSVGGYSPAKLKIYQEMIDSVGLYPPRLPLNMNVLSMLNTKYLIVPGQLPGTNMTVVNVDRAKRLVLYRNPDDLGRAFFVDNAVVAGSKKELFALMNSPSWNPRTTAILEKQPAIAAEKSDSAFVRITRNFSQDEVLETYCSKPSLLVYSEAYYPAGWTATIDGKETEIYKTNYVIRSVVVPAGSHTVEFQFAPTRTYWLGLTLTHTAWIVTFVIIVIGAVGSPAVRKKLGMGKKQTDDGGKSGAQA